MAQHQNQKFPVSIKDLLEAGAHFGHQTRRWNPKMKRFIFEERNGLYIIDLAKTLQQIRNAVECCQKTSVERHKSILFVGTKKQAKAVLREIAEAVWRVLCLRALARWNAHKFSNNPSID